MHKTRPFDREIIFTDHALNRCYQRLIGPKRIAKDLRWILDGNPERGVYKRRLTDCVIIYERTDFGAVIITVYRRKKRSNAVLE